MTGPMSREQAATLMAGMQEGLATLGEFDQAFPTPTTPPMIETLDAPSAFKVKARPVQMLRPLGDRLIVLPDPPEDMVGLIHKPDIAQERPARGTVVAIGPAVSAVQVGDRVLYGHFTGAEMEHNGAEHLCLREDDVFCVSEIVEK